MSASETSHLNKQFGWLLPLLKALPVWMVKLTNPQMMQMIDFQKSIEDQVREIMDGENDNYKTATHPTIFHELLNCDLSPEEKTLARLVDEGQTVVGAGMITTAHYLTVTAFHILANPSVLQTLKAELTTAMPDPVTVLTISQLEQLPYLSAVVLEGFRVSYGVSSRLQRVSPDEPLKFREWVIPAGTPVGMTSIFTHENPAIFPEPKEFRPDRWLKGGDSSKERLSKYLVNFSKGTRMCLGMNLAYAEIYLTLAALFRRFELELFETTREDVDPVHDFFNPSARLDSKGVRVLVK